MSEVTVDEEFISIKVRGDETGEVQFKMRRKTEFKKLFEAYATRANRSLRTLRFLYEGKRVTAVTTAEKLNLKNGDVIECMSGRAGGSGEVAVAEHDQQ